MVAERRRRWRRLWRRLVISVIPRFTPLGERKVVAVVYRERCNSRAALATGVPRSTREHARAAISNLNGYGRHSHRSRGRSLELCTEFRIRERIMVRVTAKRAPPPRCSRAWNPSNDDFCTRTAGKYGRGPDTSKKDTWKRDGRGQGGKENAAPAKTRVTCI